MLNVRSRQATRAALKKMRSDRIPNPFSPPDIGPTEPVIALWKHPSPAILFWRAFVDAGGLVLDPVIWARPQEATAGIAALVEQALSNGWSSGKVAAKFLFETPERNDWLRVDDGYQITPCYDLRDMINDLFTNSINRAYLGIQVLQGVAPSEELDRLDEMELPTCDDEDEAAED